MNGSPCPCGPPAHPRTISNPAGLAAVAYRVGDYAAFREALLRGRPGEAELLSWRPAPQGDLALQLVEWWAYLADVLTFYNERAANQAYLRTADLPESLRRLVRLLGYRPRPGIAATGTLAALTAGPNPFTLPRGFQVQSKPGPGQQPQVFELDADVTVTPPAAGPTPAAPAAAPVPVESGGSVLLAGNTTAVKAGDRVLLLPVAGASPAPAFAVATVARVGREKDALGNAVTRVTFAADANWATLADPTQYRLLRTDLSSQVWQYPADENLVIVAQNGALQVDLATLVRSVKVGDPVVLDGPAAPLPQCATVTASTEAIWYANPAVTDVFLPEIASASGGLEALRQVSAVTEVLRPEVALGGGLLDELRRRRWWWTRTDPSVPPAPPTVPIPIPHTRITLPWQAGAVTDNSTTRPTYLVRYGWKEVGPLIALPAATVGGGAAGTPAPLQPPDGSPFPADEVGMKVLMEDANGHGAAGAIDTTTSVSLVPPVPVLVPPLRVLTNLLPVSRGKTVANEVLGSGNALVAGQDFVLQKAPVTYLSSPDSTSGDGYASTVRVWVNGLEWSEVRGFYGQPPGAQVFVTREDEQGQTHVVFGDGQNGARLPTGVNNVVATYRYGSGADAPPAGSLTAVLNPQPGLRAVRNPVAVGGGSAPDAPDKVRRLAPRSLRTFDRAVSVDDFESVAAGAPGVVRAKAAVAFDPQAQRPAVTVWVGDDANAVSKAREALANSAGPDRAPRVVAARAVVMTLRLTVVIDPRRSADAVLAAVRAALIDPDAGLLGVNVVGIGQAFYDSQVYAACLAVPGVVAVRGLLFTVTNLFLEAALVRNRLYVRELLLRRPVLDVPGVPTLLIWTVPRPLTGERHDPGAGAFLFLPDDARHLVVTQGVAS
jgi:hypothetical protein